MTRTFWMLHWIAGRTQTTVQCRILNIINFNLQCWNTIHSAIWLCTAIQCNALKWSHTLLLWALSTPMCTMSPPRFLVIFFQLRHGDIHNLDKVIKRDVGIWRWWLSSLQIVSSKPSTLQFCCWFTGHNCYDYQYPSSLMFLVLLLVLLLKLHCCCQSYNFVADSLVWL